MIEIIKYKQVKNIDGSLCNYQVQRLTDYAYIPYDVSNGDYLNFKSQIISSEAILEDTDGVDIPQDEAIAYVGTLP